MLISIAIHFSLYIKFTPLCCMSLVINVLFPGAKKGSYTRVMMSFPIGPGSLLHHLVLSMLIISEDAFTHFFSLQRRKGTFRD